MSDKPKNYMNPYLAGIMLGLVLLATIYIKVADLVQVVQ